MKIIYEPGDVVSVEDNCQAGVFGACTVRLMKKIGKDRWQAELVDAPGGMTPPETGEVSEIFLRPYG